MYLFHFRCMWLILTFSIRLESRNVIGLWVHTFTKFHSNGGFCSLPACHWTSISPQFEVRFPAAPPMPHRTFTFFHSTTTRRHFSAQDCRHPRRLLYVGRLARASKKTTDKRPQRSCACGIEVEPWQIRPRTDALPTTCSTLTKRHWPETVRLCFQGSNVGSSAWNALPHYLKYNYVPFDASSNISTSRSTSTPSTFDIIYSKALYKYCTFIYLVTYLICVPYCLAHSLCYSAMRHMFGFAVMFMQAVVHSHGGGEHVGLRICVDSKFFFIFFLGGAKSRKGLFSQCFILIGQCICIWFLRASPQTVTGALPLYPAVPVGEVRRTDSVPTPLNFGYAPVCRPN